MASVILAYFLWLIGGFFGIHHLYLGRLNQAFVWCATLGGVLGLGWFRDVWKIPSYVQWRNKDKDCQKQYLTRKTEKPQPSCGYVRSLGMYVFGNITSMVLYGLMPNYEDLETELSSTNFIIFKMCGGILVIAGVTIGITIVANIGEMQCSFTYPLFGALLSIPWIYYYNFNTSMPSMIASAAAGYFGMRWRPFDLKSRRDSLNILIFIVGISLWSSVFVVGLYNHAQIPLENGGKIPLKVALHNLFASPAWFRMRVSINKVYVIWLEEGWLSALNEALDLLDVDGENKAFELLGLPENATQKDVNKQCRKLSSIYHPDRQKTPEAKSEAEVKFLQIREACNVLIIKPYQKSQTS